MKKLWLIILAIIILAAGAAVVFVMSIDWNEHKAKISSQFSELTGKKVVFQGPISLSFFPSPNLTAQNVKIYSEDPKIREPLAEIKSLVARLTLVPFLKGEFDVKRMSLVEPVVRFSMIPESGFNWKSSLNADQRRKLKELQLKLDSVTIEKATVLLSDPSKNINWRLDSLNGEVIADSVMGPYKIEGSYIKDNNPEGFAIAIGSLTENIATQLNLTFTNPATETMFRFDGSVLPQNSAINGNIIFDSRRLMNFVNLNFKEVAFDKNYDFPLAVSAEVTTNKERIEFNNMVVKYGETAAAGNVIIPRADVQPEWNGEQSQEDSKKIELAFDLTNFDLQPLVTYLTQKKVEYEQPGKVLEINPTMNIIADINAVKAKYQDQEIRDLSLSMDVVHGKISVNKFQALFPGETETKFTGSIFANENGALNYEADLSLNSDEFINLLRSFKINPPLPTAAVYKKFRGAAKLEGDLQELKITPMDFVLDKSKISGDIAWFKGDRNRLFVLLEADNINFDNYINPLPKDIAGQDFNARLQYRFGKLGFLNDQDIQFSAKLGLGIYENTPFENTQFEGKINAGILEISKLDIASLSGAKVDLSGQVSGFGKEFRFSNLKYALQTSEMIPFLNKFGINSQDFDPKIFKNFDIQGITTGAMTRFAVKTVAKVEDNDFSFGGIVDRRTENTVYDGDLYLKSSDFVKMLNNLGVNYSPNVYSLGLMMLNAKVAGTIKNWKAEQLKLSIGQNTANGNLVYDATLDRPKISGKLDVNQFEPERFFYNGAVTQNKEVVAFRKPESEQAAFLAKPLWNSAKIDYDFYNRFDLNLDLQIEKLLYDNKLLSNTSLELVLDNGKANFNNFKAKVFKGEISGNAELNMKDDPALKLEVTARDLSPDDSFWSGQKYGLSYGALSGNMTVQTDASSGEEMIKNLDGDIHFEVTEGAVKGWDLEMIYNDLVKRKNGDGLATAIKSALETGRTEFDSFRGSILLKKGTYHIEDALMETENYRLGVTVNGNLLLWDLNAYQTINFTDLKRIPAVNFIMRGSLADPLLEVLVESIVKMYQDEQNEIISRQKEAEKQYRERLEKLLNEQMALVKTLETRMIAEIKPKLAAYTQNAKSQKAISQLKGMSEEMDNIGKGIAEVVTLGMTPKYDEQLIETAKRRNGLLTKRIDAAEQDIILANMEDIKFRMNDIYNQITKINTAAKAKINDFQDIYDGFNKRLNAAKSDYYLEKDPRAEELNQGARRVVVALDNINTDMYRDYIQMQSSTNEQQLEEYIKRLQLLYEEALEKEKDLAELIQSFEAYGESQVKNEEEAYQARKREAEIKRKLKENTGKISVAGAGKSVTVVRDITEIEKSEGRQGMEEVKVLEFSQEPEVNIIKKQGYILKEKKPLQESKILRPIEGKVSKASGVIVKK